FQNLRALSFVGKIDKESEFIVNNPNTSKYKAATRFGYNLIKTWSNNTVCDEPKFDTIYSCIGFRRSAEFKVEGDSVILNNTSFEGYHDSVLLKVKNEKNELVDSVWVSKIDYYVKTLSNGTYTAFINSNSPCDTIETIKFEITTSSLANLMSFKIDIFPNPVTSHATVLFNYSKGNYSILDLTGRKVSKGVLTKGSNEIKLTHIPKGVYIIEISQNQSVYRTRLVKE
ncbi:MAG: T9SS type A sorting domain-containing protein, partial [Bacteroidia bacterium]